MVRLLICCTLQTVVVTRPRNTSVLSLGLWSRHAAALFALISADSPGMGEIHVRDELQSLHAMSRV